MFEHMKRTRTACLTACLAATTLLIATDGEALDYWLAPEQASIKIGETARIQLFKGDQLEVEREQPLDKEITTRYEWLTSSESIDLLSSLPDRVQPVFKRPVKSTGLLVMDMDFKVVEGTYEQFREFIEREEHEAVAKKVKNLTGKTSLRYAWSMKSLALVGAKDDKGLHGREVGQTLEILLLENPRLIEPGEELGVQVLFEGKPLRDQLVRVFIGNDDGLAAEMKSHTDAKGIARFKAEQKGLWLIRSTHVLKSKSTKDASWDTHFANFSFHYR
jgi:hypothetical protein